MPEIAASTPFFCSAGIGKCFKEADEVEKLIQDTRRLLEELKRLEEQKQLISEVHKMIDEFD